MTQTFTLVQLTIKVTLELVMYSMLIKHLVLLHLLTQTLTLILYKVLDLALAQVQLLLTATRFKQVTQD